MADEIINKVANSGLITLDLEESHPHWEVVGFDMADVLWEGLVLKESAFRAFVKDNDWTSFNGKSVFIHCSTDAIIPTWAYMLLATALEPFASLCIIGSEEDLQLALWRKFIEGLDLSIYTDQRVIVKGCSDTLIPETVYLELSTKLKPVVRTLMFGEPCSTVPIYKRK